MIVAACIPTLRPLYLVIFHRPGREAYISPKKGHAGSRAHPRRPAGISDSQTAIGNPLADDSWLEIPDGDDKTVDKRMWPGEITQTIELSVMSKQKSAEAEASDGSLGLLPPAVLGGNAV